MAIQLDEATIYCICFATLLLGISTILYIATVYILVFKRRRSVSLNKPILVVASVMYIVAILSLAVEIRRAVLAFIRFGGTPGGATTYLFNVTDPLYLASKSLNFTQTLLGDCFITYRLYMVWGRNKFIVIPAILGITGCFVSGVGSLTILGSSSPSTSVFTQKRWVAAIFVTTLITNTSSTILISLKIWMTERRTTSAFRSRSLSPVIAVIIESGSLYSLSFLIVLVLFLNDSWAQYIVLDMTTQIVGITYFMIVVRMGLHLSPEDSAWSFRNSTAIRGHKLHKLPGIQTTHTTTVVNIKGQAVEGRTSDDDGVGSASIGTLNGQEEAKLEQGVMGDL